MCQSHPQPGRPIMQRRFMKYVPAVRS